MMTFEQKLKCAQRELRYRRRVYARRVASFEMSKSQADYEIECMEEIVKDYENLAKDERLL